MGVQDYGTAAEHTDNPSLADWAAAVAAALNTSDTTVNDRITTAVAQFISANLVDAKGDLLVGSANDTIARLAVGSNNYVLTADSNESTGVKWAAGGSSAVTEWCMPRSTEWIGAPYDGSTSSGGPYTGTCDPMWFMLPLSGTFGTVSCRCITGDTGSPLVKGLLYNSDSNGFPDQLVYTTPAFDVSVSGTELNNTIAGGLNLSAGKYWWGAIGTGGTGAYRIRSVIQHNPSPVDGRSFHEMSVGATMITLDVGTYASPRSDVTNYINYNYGYSSSPYFSLRRS